MIRFVLSIAVAILLFLFLIWPGHFWGKPVWEALAAQSAQQVQAQLPLPTSTPYPTPTTQAAQATYTPNPTYTPLPGQPTSVPAVTTTPVPAKPAAVRGPNDPPTPWTEVEFQFAGDHRAVYNHDNDGKPTAYLTWFQVRVHKDTGVVEDLGACSLRVTTAPDGERLSTPGAFRKFGLPAIYTKDQLYELTRWWIGILETEPRGACAKVGAYSVSWQDPNLAPSNPQGRP